MDGSIPAGTIVGGRWRILGVLGEGGFGQVLLAEDVSEVGLGRGAVKVLHPDTSPKERQDFLDEVKKMAALRHQNLVGYLDSGLLRFDGEALPDHGGEIRPFLVTELCDRSLQDELKATPGGRLDPVDVRRVLTDVAAGLAHLHERGMIHRDIKPGNVLVSGGTWKLADFGLTRDLSATGTYHRGELLMGTPLFMAPELFTTMSANPPSDVYAFGVLAHLVATGRPVHQGSGLALIRNITSSAPTIDPTLDGNLARVIAVCLDPRPEQRPTAGQLAGLLRDGGMGEGGGSVATVAAMPPPAPVVSPSWPAPNSGPQDAISAPLPPAHWADPSGPRSLTAEPAASTGRRRTGLFAVGAAVAALIVGGAGLFALLDRGGDALASSGGTDPSIEAADSGDRDDAEEGGLSIGDVSIGEDVVIGGGASTTVPSDDGPATPVVDPLTHFAAVPCATGPGTVVELTNRHDVPVDYWIEADHLDAAGTTIDQSYENVLALEPGQTALVDLTSLEETATSCALTTFTAVPTPDEVLAANDEVELVSCVLNEFLGNWYDLTYTVNNANDFAAEASVAFGIVDAEGVRLDESFTKLSIDIAPGQRIREESFEVFRTLDLTDREPAECVVTWVEITPW